MPRKQQAEVVSSDNGSGAIVRRLDALLGLVAEWELTDSGVVRRGAEAQTIRLSRAGMRPVEIATITGRALSNITRDISRARKRKLLPRAAATNRRRRRSG